MRKTMRALILGVLTLLVSSIALAGNNANPFGVEVGVATLADVQKAIGTKTRLNQTGTNKYTGGKMFTADGAGLDVEGVNEITFIFDQANVLAAVLVKMPKDPKALAKTFSGKYQVVSNRIDGFMNYGYARFQKGNTVIEIDAPHLSFDMEVRYLTKALMAAYLQQSSSDEAAKQKRKADSL